jgi:hypothetical protein
MVMDGEVTLVNPVELKVIVPVISAVLRLIAMIPEKVANPLEAEADVTPPIVKFRPEPTAAVIVAVLEVTVFP